MAGVSARLFNWWQEKSNPKDQPNEPVTEDVTHLFRLCREHRLLLVTQRGVKDQYQSMLLEVDLINRRILLDEPFPHEHPIEYWLGRRLDLASIEGGVNTRFESRVMGFENRDHGAALSLNIPVEVVAAQRRKNFRLVVDDSIPVKAVLRIQDLGNVAAKVLDLSVGGVRVAIPGHYESIKGAKINLRMGLDSSLICELGISSVQQLAEDDITLIGAELLSLHPEQIKNIQRFLARSQRQQRQRELELNGA